MSIGAFGLSTLDTNGVLANKDKNISNLQHKIVLGIMTLLVLLLFTLLGPIPLLVAGFIRR